MHYLNVMSTNQSFLTLRPPLVCWDDSWDSEEGPLAISTDSILFVVELSKFRPNNGESLDVGEFIRAMVRLKLADYIIEGFVHVPLGGTPISRVIQDRHPFIALTDVSVSGPGGSFEVPFLAVCHQQINAVQEIQQASDPEKELQAVECAEP
jgi:hypothetical protein